ncbi:MAG: RimK family alpha-L-glutamate ligase [Acidobacteriota bacterium]|nr:MAG: RimK family alpha-L-glutamate ligase [Acidobacteriota bacterium]
MRIGILSRAPRCYSTSRLRRAATSRGHRARVLDVLQFAICLDQGGAHLYYRNKPAPRLDAIIPRVGTGMTSFGTAVMRHYESLGVRCVNSAKAFANARDKLRALQILAGHGLAVPHTECVRSVTQVESAVARVGGPPVVVKLIEGAQGVGVMLAQTVEEAATLVAAFRTARQDVLIQEFVHDSRGRDIRALVVGDKVMAAMRRLARGSEFRCNVHRGAYTEPVVLDRLYEKAALEATQALELRVAGADLLETPRGPLVTEVNASPGLEGIEKTVGADVAGAIVDELLREGGRATPPSAEGSRRPVRGREPLGPITPSA